MTIVKRQSMCFRPLYIDDKQLSNIIFYDESGILYESHQGWLELNGQDTIELHLPEVRNARTINPDNKDCFIVKSKEDYKKDCYTLYIYADGTNIVVSKPIERIHLETKTETNYKLVYDVIVPHIIPVPKLNEQGELKYEDSHLITTATKMFSRYYSKSVPTDFGKQVDEISEVFKSRNINLTSYDVEKILENFTIERKK